MQLKVVQDTRCQVVYMDETCALLLVNSLSDACEANDATRASCKIDYSDKTTMLLFTLTLLSIKKSTSTSKCIESLQQ